MEELLDDLIRITELFETKNETYLTLEKQFLEQKKVITDGLLLSKATRGDTPVDCKAD